MSRQVRRQMRRHADRPDARPAAAMRNAKGLVQVQMRDVRPKPARRAQPDQRVQVRAVHVNLPAVPVHDLADLDDALLEHAVSRRIGHHERGEPVRVLRGVRLEILDVDIAVLVATHDDDGHPGHGRARRVGAVCRARDQADVALALAARCVIAADDQKACIFALRSGIGLQRHRSEAGDPLQHVLEPVDQGKRAFRLIERHEGVNACKCRPGDRQHLGRRVQLHGAGAERNHRPVERNVPRLKAPQIAQHLRFRTMAIEHRMGQAARRSLQRRRNRIRLRLVQRVDRKARIGAPGNSAP